MAKKVRVDEKKRTNGHKTIIFIFIMVIAVFSAASIDTGATIAYIGDAEPKTVSDIQEFTKDLNQVIPLAPTGKVDALFLMGDMETISNTLQSINASTVKNVPIYFVIGNYEASSNSETALIQARYSNSSIPLTSGPPGTDKTTYSMNVGSMHVINMNEYWDGAADDSYGNGYIQDALYNWISDDLSGTANYKIVVGHEPLFPVNRHAGDSLDANITNRDNLQSLFASKNVDIFIGGHTHNAGVQNISGVFHVNSGTSGSGPNPAGNDSLGPEDSFASILYTYTNDTGSFLLTLKRENSTWDTPAAISYTISEAEALSTIPPAPSLPSRINITSYAPLSPVYDNVGATRTFNLTVNDTVDVTWYINGTQVCSNSSVAAGNYTNISAKSGTWNVSAIANNSKGSVIHTWIWIVSDLIANAGGPYTGIPGVLINFTGSASGGTVPYSYNWSFGDGRTSSHANPSHAYSNKGSYFVNLIVTDSAGISSLDTAPVSVEWVRFINGTVMDRVNKSGLAGVKVFTNISLSTVTDASGFYSFSINSGAYNITAMFEPVYYTNSTTVSLLGAVVVQDIELLKKPKGNITGSIA